MAGDRFWIYRGVRSVLRPLMRVYFAKIETAGRDRVSGGPVIFAANHPQSITDALVLGYAVPRVVRFLAHGGLFRARWRAWFLHRAGVIPVYRQSDAPDASARNQAMFSACFTALSAGHALGIFPEGASREERKVQELRTGTARIALGAAAEHDFSLGVQVVPVGIHFDSVHGFRSRVLVDLGRPLEARDYREAYAADPQEAVRAFTRDLKERITGRVVHLERDELELFLEDVESTYKSELLAKLPPLEGDDSDLRREAVLSRAFARAVDYYAEHDPRLVWRLQGMLKRYRRLQKRMRLDETLLRRAESPSVRREFTQAAVMGALGLVPALYGALWNALPYKLTGWIAFRLATDETKIHWFQLSVGSVVYALYYVPLAYAVYRMFGGWPAAWFLASWVPTGFFARWYFRHMVERRDAVRFAVISSTQSYSVSRLRAMRRELLRSLDAVREDYVSRRTAAREANAVVDVQGAGGGEGSGAAAPKQEET